MKALFLFNFFILVFSFYTWSLAQLILSFKIYQNKTSQAVKENKLPVAGIFEMSRGLFFVLLFGIITHLFVLVFSHKAGYLFLAYPVFIVFAVARIPLGGIVSLKSILRLTFRAGLSKVVIKNKLAEGFLFTLPRIAVYVSSGIFMISGIALLIFNKFLK